MARIAVVAGASAFVRQRMESPVGVGVVAWVCGRCRQVVGSVNADRAAADAAIGYEELCGACMSAVAVEEGDDY